MPKLKTTYFIGTSGWVYKDWKGVFYPDSLSQQKWFGYYAQHFRSVEINATFYRFFKDSTYQKWYKRAPDDFKYVLKVPRLISHYKKLQDADDIIKSFEQSAMLLKEKLGNLLLQIPSNMPYEPERLDKALKTFQHPELISVEIRKKEWLTDEFLDILHKNKSSYCNPDEPGWKLDHNLTSQTGYLRLHGRNDWYNHEYDATEMDEIRDCAFSLSEQGARQVFIFFDNTAYGYALKNAMELINIMEHG